MHDALYSNISKHATQIVFNYRQNIYLNSLNDILYVRMIS